MCNCEPVLIQKSANQTSPDPHHSPNSENQRTKTGSTAFALLSSNWGVKTEFAALPNVKDETRLTYNCAHLRYTKESLTVEFGKKNVGKALLP